MHIVLVESPTKTKTLEKFLGKEYKVLASGGHVRDLPKSKLGIDVDSDFEPQYVIPPRARKNIKNLKEEIKNADTVYLGTDPDREGEAISYHLLHVLGLKNYKRITFNEITKSAVEEATKRPRDIDMNLVDAQQARRVLDRLVGYKLSPFLWKKVTRGLSAGRVQSAALWIVTEREKEIEAFKSEEYWSINALLDSKEGSFQAELKERNGEKIEKGDVKGLPNKEDAQRTKKDLEKAGFTVKSIKQKEKKRSPLPPFTTSTMQQEAFKRLRFPSKVTMYIAQSLYEKGLITYHRTDSLHLSKEAKDLAKEYIERNYGKKYYKERSFTAKGRSQEAHEAIRPTSLSEKQGLKREEVKLYDLIKRRFLASLMSEAVFYSTNIEVEARNKNEYLLSANGSIMQYDGFIKVYPIKFQENELPQVKEKEKLEAKEIMANQHFTKPPARFTEATLIKELEKHGIGRPSTYVPILSRIDEKNYTEKVDKKYLKPTEIGRIVSDLLANHFPFITDLKFTAHMEEDLDKVAEGKRKWQNVIRDFYKDFIETLQKKEKELKKEDLMQEETNEKCDKCGGEMIIRMGKYGKFMACKSFPECKNTKPLEEDEEDTPEEEITCDKCNAKMQIKKSKFGKFYGCTNYPQCKNIKSLEGELDIKCPDCKEGNVVKKKSRKGKDFYACDRYPDCTFTSSKKPSSEDE